MLGLTNFVIVIVVNNLSDSDKKPTNWFDKVPIVSLAARRTIYADTTGNVHARSNIQKQAYTANQVTTVRQAYGITGTKFGTHSPYRNGEQISLDDPVKLGDEIVLVRDGLNVHNAIKTASKHRIMPERKGS